VYFSALVPKLWRMVFGSLRVCSDIVLAAVCLASDQLQGQISHLQSIDKTSPNTFIYTLRLYTVCTRAYIIVEEQSGFNYVNISWPGKKCVNQRAV